MALVKAVMSSLTARIFRVDVHPDEERDQDPEVDWSWPLAVDGFGLEIKRLRHAFFRS